MRVYTNYQKFLKEIEEVKKLNYKPSLLLHCCCGPCAGFPLYYLRDYFDITIFFNNSNIYPKSEYDKRLDTLTSYVNHLNRDAGCNIKLITTPYDYDFYDRILSKRKGDKEGNIRCFTCYSLRYKELCEYASRNNFDYVASVMTISRYKNEEMINKILEGYSSKYSNIKYLYSNFKKDKGLEKGQRIAKDNKMYMQKYCGCRYSQNN